MWKSCGIQGRLRWCAASCHVVAGFGTLFWRIVRLVVWRCVVPHVVVLCRVGMRLVVWRRVVVSLRCVMACVVLCRVALDGVVLCRVLSGCVVCCFVAVAFVV